VIDDDEFVLNSHDISAIVGDMSVSDDRPQKPPYTSLSNIPVENKNSNQNRRNESSNSMDFLQSKKAKTIEDNINNNIGKKAQDYFNKGVNFDRDYGNNNKNNFNDMEQDTNIDEGSNTN